MRYSLIQRSILLTLVLSLPMASQAHFAWLSSDDDGRALLYFAESPAKPDYKLPEAIAKATVMLQVADSNPEQVKVSKVEADGFIGLKSEKSAIDTGVLTSHCQYGNYHGTLLTYYMKHYAGKLAAAIDGEQSEQPKDFVFDLRPAIDDKAIVLTATRNGEPLKGVGITLIDPSGERADKETDAKGVAKFYNVVEGNLAFIAAHTEKKQGEINGEKYKSLSNYLTLTFDYSTKAEEGTTAAVESALPALPEGLASFGAATAEGYVYVYSGHIGKAHAHSNKNLSKHFRRMSLSGGEWEDLPCTKPLQGLAFVPHAGKLYRVGGMQARNAPEEDEDLHSTDTVEMFDTVNRSWRTLPSLPEPRSSHDAVVIDGTLYVVGGWKLAGNSDGEWLNTAWKLDLGNIESGWKKLPEVPFFRRAITATFVPGMLVVIGGIDDAGAISREVDALDLDTGEWRKLAELPGDGMQGFGCSAWNHDGNAYVSGSSGVVWQLVKDGSSWKEAAKHTDRRFFHRLIPAGDNRLLMIGGASIDRSKHVGDSEWVELKPDA